MSPYPGGATEFRVPACDTARVTSRDTIDHPLRRDRRRSTHATAAGLAALALTATACAGDTTPSAERFCGEVDARRAELTSPDLEFSDEVEPLLDLYREIGELAPLSIESEWDRLTSAYETASTIVPGDEESEQIALGAIFSTETSAAAIDQWLETNCAVDIGPVFTIVAQE